MPSLTDFPVEILHQIAWELSPRTSASLQDVQEHYQDGLAFALSDRIEALSRLSMTCKYFREIAQLKLFHSVFDTDETAVSLLQTFCSRPDLAAAVIELQVGGHDYRPANGSENLLSPETVFMFNRLLSENFKNVTQNPPPLEYDPSHSAVDAFAALAIALAFNVKRLLIRSFYWALPVYKMDSLSSLTELILVHGDTEGGFDLSNFQVVLEAAPCLQILRCHMVDNFEDAVSHNNVTTLDIGFSALSGESFQRLIGGFPRLESFSYSCGGGMVAGDDATPREIFEAIRIRSKALKHLSLDLQLYTELVGQDDYIKTLAGMEVLQTLEVSASALEVSALALADEREPANENILIDFLPPNIRSFKLLNPHRSMAKAINRLADSAAERFPGLKEVTFFDSHKYPSFEVPETTFTSRGIDCKNTGPY